MAINIPSPLAGFTESFLQMFLAQQQQKMQEEQLRLRQEEFKLQQKESQQRMELAQAEEQRRAQQEAAQGAASRSVLGTISQTNPVIAQMLAAAQQQQGAMPIAFPGATGGVYGVQQVLPEQRQGATGLSNAVAPELLQQALGTQESLARIESSTQQSRGLKAAADLAEATFDDNVRKIQLENELLLAQTDATRANAARIRKEMQEVDTRIRAQIVQDARQRMNLYHQLVEERVANALPGQDRAAIRRQAEVEFSQALFGPVKLPKMEEVIAEEASFRRVAAGAVGNDPNAQSAYANLLETRRKGRVMQALQISPEVALHIENNLESEPQEVLESFMASGAYQNLSREARNLELQKIADYYRIALAQNVTIPEEQRKERLVTLRRILRAIRENPDIPIANIGG